MAGTDDNTDSHPMTRAVDTKLRFASPPTLVEAITEELRRRILHGLFRPGERITEERIVAELGHSRPPVREALRLLERDGLVTAMPRRGVVVASLTPTDVREIYDLRHALEELAIELALPIDDPAKLKPVRQALQEMERAVTSGTVEELPLLNLRFHQAMVRLAGNSRLDRSYDGLAGQLQMCMAVNLRFRERLSGNPAESVERHAVLVRSLEAGDKEATKQAMRDHGDRSFLDNLEETLDPV
jgi:DNA-binding GntR family transcriptional regulator